MTEEPEITREGLLEKFVGKAKEAAGELVGNAELAEAGREQQAQVDADAVEAAREEAPAVAPARQQAQPRRPLRD
jgi:uncharacterized protein YjbJ (UPF0337 family)